jgi:hypothetical protein
LGSLLIWRTCGGHGLVAEVASTTLSAALKAQEAHLQSESNMSRNLDRIVEAARLAQMGRAIDG